jgi:hypothetical protein
LTHVRRIALLAAVFGTSVVFLDATVTSVALLRFARTSAADWRARAIGTWIALSSIVAVIGAFIGDR